MIVYLLDTLQYRARTSDEDHLIANSILNEGTLKIVKEVSYVITKE